MRNVMYGALGGALVFGLVSWASVRKPASAAVLAKPPEGRFELVQLHASHEEAWSGILDTETGCVWAYFSQTPPASPETTSQFYFSELGPHYLGTANFDVLDYISPDIENTGGSSGHLPGRTANFSKPLAELSRVSGLCDRARVEALEAAAAR